METYDVIVLGAGPGGTTVANLLAHSGKRVLLVDKNKTPGGRMSTFERDGFRYELFPLNGVPSVNSLFEKLSAALGRADDVKPILAKEFGKIGKICYEDRRGNVRVWEMGDSPVKMLQTLGVELWNLPALIRTARFFAKLSAMPQAQIEQLQDVSALEYVRRCGPLPEGVFTYFLAAFAEGVYEMSADRVPAAEAIRAFQTAAKDGGGRYYEGGIGHFFEVMAQEVEDCGGWLLMNTRVTRILLENGAAVGIETQDGATYHARLVSSSAGVRQTALKLVGEEHFDEAYIERLSRLENNLACVGYRYFTNAPVLDDVMMVYFPHGCVGSYEEFTRMARGESKPQNNYIYIGTTSLYPGMAPAGKQLVYACMSCAPDPKLDVKPYLAYVEKLVRKIVPALYDHVERAEVMGPATVPAVGNDAVLDGQGGESYGIAMSVGQSGKLRPSAKSPIPGLYYVGNDVEGVGLGTHMAVDSGFKVFEMVKDL